MSKVLEIVKNECPYCNTIIYVNKRSFANHVRWCNQNPKYEEIKQNTINKLKIFNNSKSTRKKHDIVCEICGKHFIVNITDISFKKGKYRKTCCNECAKKLTSKNTNKENKNIKISNSINRYIEKYGFLGSVHGVTRAFLIKRCLYCDNEFKTKILKKKFCSRECGNKYKHKQNIKKLDIKEIYRLQTVFKFNLNDYPEEFDFSLIKECGWYKAKNHGDNLNGISRDHMFSVSEGFKQGIDPYYISHPANCKLMKHEDNFKKNKYCSITKEELFQKVNEWNEKYGIYTNKINYTFIENFRGKK